MYFKIIEANIGNNKKKNLQKDYYNDKFLLMIK